MNKMILAMAALLFTVAAHARTVNCMAFDGDAEDESNTVTLTLNGNKISMKTDATTFEGELDTTYQPRLNKNYVRYTGDYRDLVGEEADVWILVEKSLLKGQSGQIKVQGRGEGFDTTTYRCE